MIAIKSFNLQLHWGYRTRINKITVYSNDLRTIHCWKDIKRPILENISMYWKSLRKHQKYYHRINSVETTDFIMHIIVMCHNTCLWDFFYFEAKLCVLVPETKKRPKVIWNKKEKCSCHQSPQESQYLNSPVYWRFTRKLCGKTITIRLIYKCKFRKLGKAWKIFRKLRDLTFMHY